MTLEIAKQSIGCTISHKGTKYFILGCDSFREVPHWRMAECESWPNGKGYYIVKGAKEFYVGCEFAGQAEF